MAAKKNMLVRGAIPTVSITRRVYNVRFTSTIVESVHLIGRTLKIKTVAESVEIAEVAQALTEIGIDAAQGWLYSKPAPLAEVCEAL